MNVIEKAARALCALNDLDPDSSLGGDGENFMWMHYANFEVRVVLENLREPENAAWIDGLLALCGPGGGL